jgi:predicted XRE-type DNA-binding protein
MSTTRKSAKAERLSLKREKIEISSGNVFADLGFEDSEERLLKAKLASKIAQLIEHRNQESQDRGPRSLK